jgi:intracellular septation protein A
MPRRWQLLELCLDPAPKIPLSAAMALSYWRYPTRHFSINGITIAVDSRAKTDGLHSSLSVMGVEMASDQTPNFGPEAVRNHSLSGQLPDGRKVEVELGWIGAWSTGIVARMDEHIVYESHPGQTPAYPEKLKKSKEKQGDTDPFATGVFAKHNRLPFAIDIATGLLFYVIAKMTNLQTAAMVGVVVGFGLVLFQRITKIDVTGGLALFGIVMLCISAGLAWFLNDDEWIKMRGTITGIIGASFFIIDGLRGGPYIGKGMIRYMPYDDIIPGRFALAMGCVGLFMAALNYGAAKLLSTDHWLFYTTFVDIFIVMALATFAINFARKKPSQQRPD